MNEKIVQLERKYMFNQIQWINPKERKPEGDIFWALTEGRVEQGECDWVIRKIFNCELGDYRTLDGATSYRFAGTYNGQSWYNTIFAWLPLDAIPIRDKDWL